MRVSVVVALYNKANYVRRALDSIAAQTLSDFEVIVVDDGSTDGGEDTVAAYPDRRIRLIRQPNAGPGAARNRGIAEARGEFLACLDADDEWFPEYLSSSVARLDSYGLSVASITSGYVEQPQRRSIEKMLRARGLTDGIHRVGRATDPALVVSMLAFMSPCSTVVRTEVARKWGGFFSRDRCRYAEDAFLWLKVLLNETVAFHLAPLARFDRQASGLSNNLAGARPVEPFLTSPAEIEAVCPPHLHPVLTRVLATRAFKTACVLGYWGQWRQAGKLFHRFRCPGDWRLPYFLPALVCRTPLGPALGRSWRLLRSVSPAID